jgi:hypothetical protein
LEVGTLIFRWGRGQLLTIRAFFVRVVSWNG